MNSNTVSRLSHLFIIVFMNVSTFFAPYILSKGCIHIIIYILIGLLCYAILRILRNSIAIRELKDTIHANHFNNLL